MDQANIDGDSSARAAQTAPEQSGSGASWAKPVITRVPLELTLFSSGSGNDGEGQNTGPLN